MNLLLLSKIFRLISLAVIMAFGSYTTLLLVNESGNPVRAAFYLVPGPVIISIGILFSFFSTKRPALLRIETVFGILLTSVGGIFGAFSIGGLLITALFIITPLLIADAIFLGFIEKIQELKNTLQNKIMAIIVVFFCLLIFILIWNMAIGFAILAIQMLLPWSVLLFFSITSYLPKQKLTVYLVGLVVLLTIVSLWYFQGNQPDFSAKIYSSPTYSSSSSGSALGTVSGSTASENTEINYQELDKHNDWKKFSFNGIMYKVKPSTRTVFYGLLSQKNAHFIALQMNNEVEVKGDVEKNMFVLQSNVPKAEEKLKRIFLFNKNHHKILDEKIEQVEDEFKDW